MLFLALAVASQFTAPPPTEVLKVFSPYDMPAYVQIEEINRFVSTRTTVRPDGKPQDCSLERSSGDAKLDALTCAIIMKRGSFEPPNWVDGSPAYAIIRAGVTWAIGGPASKEERREAYPPDIQLTVRQLPSGAHSPTDIQLVIAADENGRVVGCQQGVPVDGHREKAFPQLVSVACREMTRQYSAIPAKDAAGRRVRSVQSATASFSIER
jgi:hypothetical protein